MATIEEHNDSITIFYSKRTGIINSLSTGIQDMGFFGENAEDMSVIYDFMIVPYSKDLLYNKDKYKVVDGVLVKIVVTSEEQAIMNLTAENTALKNDLELVKSVLDTLVMST